MRPAARPASAQPAPEGSESLTDRGPFALGDYVLHERLAQGGMASVYLAVRAGSEGFRRWFAVKVIRPHLAGDEGFVRMFLDEARLLSRINHPNVCSVFDAGSSEGVHYLAMEFLQGESLSEVLRVLNALSTPVAPHMAARIAADAARGLHAAHELRNADGTLAQVIHRDVSPQNIFVLYDGITKVVDFGVAQSRDRMAESTQSGIVKGKLAYLAPEQLGDGPVDRRADIFALGVVLWESTMGRRLFRRDSEAATMKAVLSAPIEDPRSTNPRFPPALGRIMMKMLQRDPDKRYATADMVARDLDAYLSTSGAASGVADVADFLRALFVDRIESQTRRIRALSESPASDSMRPRPPSIPPKPSAGLTAQTPAAVSVRAVAETDIAGQVVASDAAVVVPSKAPAVRKRGWVLAVLGILAISGTVTAIRTLDQAFEESASGRRMVRSPVFHRVVAPVAAAVQAPVAAPEVVVPSPVVDAAVPTALAADVPEASSEPALRHDRRVRHDRREHHPGASPGIWITDYDNHH